MQYPFLWMDCILWDDYIYIYVGLSALLVSTYRAMREASHSGTSDGLAPRFFFVYGMVKLFRSTRSHVRGGKHAMQWIEFQIEDNYRGRISCRGYLPSKLAVDFLAQLN